MIPPGSTSPGGVAVGAFAHHLVTATLNLELHPPGSSHLQVNLQALLQSLRDAGWAGVPMPLRLEIAGRELRHAGRALGASLQAGRLIRLCDERGIRALTFDPRLDEAEILRFLVLLDTPQQRDAFESGRIAGAFALAGIRHVEVTGRGAAQDPGEGQGASPELAGYQALADCVRDNHARSYHSRALEIDAVRGVVERADRDLREGPSGLLALASQDNVDSFTVGHSVRVALLALQVGRAVGVAREEQIRVGTAALLHDIGKSRVPQEVLFKPGRLDTDEWRLMAEHPRLGAEILIEERELDASAIGTAFCHHLAPAGLGYPKPQFPFEPSGVSKLVRVCDVFEALTSVRPYKKALSPVEAYAVMFRNESNFDPRWLRVFVRVLGLYPVGLRLRLTDGREAIVVGPGPTLHQPQVRPHGMSETVTIGEAVDGVVHRIASVITHDRSIPVGDDEAQILTNAHGACLTGLDNPEPPLRQ